MDTISKAALTAYLRNAELVEAACREALEKNLGVLVIRQLAGGITVEVTEDVPAGQIHEMRASGALAMAFHDDIVSQQHNMALSQRRTPGPW